MKLKNMSIFILVIFSTLIFYSSTTRSNAILEEVSAEEFDIIPPKPNKYTIQKLLTPLQDSSNAIFRVSYEYYDTLPLNIAIYQSNDSFLLSDDGNYPDSVARDNVYASYVRIDVEDFRSELIQKESGLFSNGPLVFFEGHDGYNVDSVVSFDTTSFDLGFEVELDAHLLTAEECASDIEKRKSLFITDLRIVEDAARTFNFTTVNGLGNAYGSGNPTGVYTFGNVMKNMANETLTGVSARTFIKEWLKHFFVDVDHPDYPLDPPLAEIREDALKYIIRPWISHANDPTSFDIDVSINLTNWEANWDATPEAELLKYAPFKLTAIVNRLDLRDNSAYFPDNRLKRAGETRFIFTLLQIVNDFNKPGGADPVGVPVVNPDFDNGTGNLGDLEDWRGMNVIFEYRNPFDNMCELQEYAQKWKDLSDYDLENATDLNSYKEKLQEVCETVIDANADSERPNGSTIGQIRTNEKILFKMDPTFNGTSTWDGSDWQFRQFEINSSTNLLDQVELNNSPLVQFIEAKNVEINMLNRINVVTYNNSVGSKLTNWAYDVRNKFRILQENHKLPNYIDGEKVLTVPLDNDLEYALYNDLDYSTQTTNFDPNQEVGVFNPDAKTLRHKLSLNTCTGCHAGETKTMFTMVAPRGYGESADYWSSTPDTRNVTFDTRSFSPVNVDHTDDGNGGSDLNYPKVSSSPEHFDIVSAFITGRTYENQSFQDDNIEPGQTNEDGTDDGMEGLYFVNDPSNADQDIRSADYFQVNDRKNGFNELQRRRLDMCWIISRDCNKPLGIFDIPSVVSDLEFMPLFE